MRKLLCIVSLVMLFACNDVVVPDYPIEIDGDVLTVTLEKGDVFYMYACEYFTSISLERAYDEDTTIEYEKWLDCDEIKHVHMVGSICD